MKNTLILLLTLFSVNVVFAQSRDIPSQGAKRTIGWSNEEEQAVTKKKTQIHTQQENNISIDNDDSEPKISLPQEQPTYDISNACEDILTVEFVSLIGSKADQEVVVTIKYINHDVEKYVKITHSKAFTEDGDVFDDMYPNAHSCDAATDVPVKAQWTIGKMLPSKNSKLTLLSFKINDCKIEMRNVPIIWK